MVVLLANSKDVNVGEAEGDALYIAVVGGLVGLVLGSPKIPTPSRTLTLGP